MGIERLQGFWWFDGLKNNCKIWCFRVKMGYGRDLINQSNKKKNSGNRHKSSISNKSMADRGLIESV